MDHFSSSLTLVYPAVRCDSTIKEKGTKVVTLTILLAAHRLIIRGTDKRASGRHWFSATIRNDGKLFAYSIVDVTLFAECDPCVAILTGIQISITNFNNH